MKADRRKNTMAALRLSEFYSRKPLTDAKKLDEVAGQELKIVGVTFGESQYGEYALIKAYNDAGEELTIITSAYYVLLALHKAEEKHEYPILATFFKDGKAWAIR
jgi:hypothetical protein